MSCNFGERPVYQPGEVEKMELSEAYEDTKPSAAAPGTREKEDHTASGFQRPKTPFYKPYRSKSLVSKTRVLAGCCLVECLSCKLWV